MKEKQIFCDSMSQSEESRLQVGYKPQQAKSFIGIQHDIILQVFLKSLAHLLLILQLFWFAFILTYKSSFWIGDHTPRLLSWCSRGNNKISIFDIETKQGYTNFYGVQLSKKDGLLTYEISSHWFFVYLSRGEL